MQHELLKYLRCPITKTALRFELIKNFEKSYSDGNVAEICDGLLFSETGFVFPVIKGIPRMLLESIYDYNNFIEKHVPDFQKLKQELESKYNEQLKYCIKKNKKTKASFEFEWNFLNPAKEDKIWHEDISALQKVFLNETGEAQEYFKNKIVLDLGSGHGIMTSKIAETSGVAIGVELSRAVENAFLNNQSKNAWYIQADLQFLPFDEQIFDVLYSSGVIHHTNNTEQSLSLIESVIKKGGKICLWLYHPQKDFFHSCILFLRLFTKRMPLKLCFFFLTIFVFPFTYTIKKLKGKKINYREEIIDLLDGFTPEFRDEIPHDIAINWLQKRNYINIKITSVNQFGFSIVGNKH